MKKLLVPIDFSDCSLKALDYAINLCILAKAQLHILHVVQVPIMAEGDSLVATEVKDDAEQKFDEVKKNNPKLDEIEYSFDLTYELITDSIKNSTNKKDIDLIVMGTKGATGSKEIFIGSNTYEAIKQVNCPVLAVPENASEFVLGSIAFASDYKKIERYQDLDELIEIAKLRNSEIHILHIGKSSTITKDELEVGKSQDQYFKSVRHSYHFISGTDVPKEINTYIKSNSIKTLAVYARKHSLTDQLFHHSLTQEMAYHSEIPLLVLPESE